MDPFGTTRPGEATGEVPDDPWRILGLGPDEHDEKSVKRAFRRLSRVIRPADDREGFRRFRTAYEAALALARGREPAPVPAPAALAAVLATSRPEAVPPPVVPEPQASEWSFPIGGEPVRSPATVPVSAPPPVSLSGAVRARAVSTGDGPPGRGGRQRQEAVDRELADEPVTEAIPAKAKPAPAAKRTLPKDGLGPRPDRAAEARRNRALLPAVVRQALERPARRPDRVRRDDGAPRDRLRRGRGSSGEPMGVIKLIAFIVAPTLFLGLVILLMVFLVRRRQEQQKVERLERYQRQQERIQQEIRRRLYGR